MADDKQNDDPAPDPWGDLLSDGPDGPAAEFSFSFDEPAEAEPGQPAADAEAPDFPAAEAEPEPLAELPVAEAAADRQLDDDLVGSWLDDGEPAVGDAAIPAVVPESDAASASSIEIGTGRSGIVEAGEVDAWEDVGPADDQPTGDAAPSGDTFSFDDPAPAEPAADEAVPFMADAVAEEAFPAVDAGLEEAAGAVAGTVVAAAGAAVRTPTKARKAAPAKKSGLGQVIGLVLGGAMAIPIVLGILVGLMWAGVNVPVGRSIGRALPESIAFIVPEKFRPGYKKPALGGGSGDVGKGSPLDALGTASPPESGTGESSPEPGTVGADLAAVPMDEPGGRESGEPLVDDAPVVPGDGETFEDPLAAAAEPAVRPAEPSPLDNARAKAEFERAAAEAAAAAAAADGKPLGAAVEQALVAVQALEEVADAEDPARKKLLVELYKSLAMVGTELVMLERISADAGRPLAAAPASLDGLHDRLGAHRDDLVRLGRNWLDFAKRPSDGVVLPVTFLSSRKIGPYWSSKVTLPQAKDGVRELVVLSRAEPAAVAGDEVVVTGMVFDGGVVWAADVRQPGRAGDGGLF